MQHHDTDYLRQHFDEKHLHRHYHLQLHPFLHLQYQHIIMIMSIISLFIIFSSSALSLLCVEIVGGVKEEVADDDDDEAVSRRNVGEGSLCLDVA